MTQFPPKKTQDTINREWDNIAPLRDAQLTAGNDQSFYQVLLPWILRSLDSERLVIDAGCGTGHLTKTISEKYTTIGIDPSSVSVDIARKNDRGTDYFVSTLEDWSTEHPNITASTLVANMVLMDSLELGPFFKAVSSVIGDGKLLATIIHPCYWPVYWGYEKDPSFNYLTECLVESHFKASGRVFEEYTTHIHRPLSMYLDKIKANGLELTKLEELRGTESREEFPFPRFIGFEARNIS